jgi:hypothetical protein
MRLEGVHLKPMFLAAATLALTITTSGRADPPFVKHGHYIQLCVDPTDWSVGPDGPYVAVCETADGSLIPVDRNAICPMGGHVAANPSYRWTEHLWVCGNALVAGARGPLQAWVDDSAQFDGSR